MNKVIQRWIRALRSGNYKQGMGKLRSSHDDEYCCLGVLCDLHRRFGKGVKWQGDHYLNERYTLPCTVIEWSGFNPDEHIDGNLTAIGMNDGMGCEPRSFTEIADALEKHYAKKGE